MEETGLKIGHVAQRAGLTPKAVRLYEARGLLAPPTRTESGYRTYTENDVALLRFIRQARALGLQLKGIKEILALQQSGATPCATVLQLVDARIREVDQAIADLRTLRATLSRVREIARAGQRRGDDAVVCQLIESQPLSDAVVPQHMP